MSLEGVSELKRQQLRYAEARRRLREGVPARVPSLPAVAAVAFLDFWPGTSSVQPVAPKVQPKIRDLLRKIAADHGLPMEQIIGEGRSNELVLVRHEFCWRAATFSGASLAAIGRLINRDHTSVIHGVRRHAERNGLPLPRGMK